MASDDTLILIDAQCDLFEEWITARFLAGDVDAGEAREAFNAAAWLGGVDMRPQHLCVEHYCIDCVMFADTAWYYRERFPEMPRIGWTVS